MTATAGLTYWMARLGNRTPVLDLPTDRSQRSPRADPGGHTAVVPCDPGDLTRIEGRTGADLFVIVAAVFAVLLARLTGQREVVLGTGRADASGEERVLPVGLLGSPTFAEVVASVRDAVRAVGEHGGAPLHRQADTLGAAGAPGSFPVAVDRVPRSGPPDDTGSDLAVLLGPTGAGTRIYLCGAADTLTAAAVTRHARTLGHLITTLAHAPDARIDEVELLPAAERDRILHGLNPYQRPTIGFTTMAQPFEEQTRRTPDAVAVIAEDSILTYAELDARSAHLAAVLRASGVRAGDFVALCAERSPHLLVALLAVAKTGAAYLPLDPDLPDARIGYMLTDAAPTAVLVDHRSRPRVPAGPWPVIRADDAAGWPAVTPADHPDPAADGGLIYLLYTSGTTGRPKGVAYPVDGALADLFWLQRSYPFRPGDTALLKTSYAFDVSIWEIFWPLYHGARVVICPPREHLDPVRVRGLIERYQVSTLFLVPSLMAPFLDAIPPGSCRSLRWVFCGGEPVTPRIRDEFHARLGGVLINCYGPTEAGTVTDMVLAPDPGAPTVPLGRPAANFRTYVLDEQQRPVPIGVSGEIYIGGEVGLAHGYHRRPGLTAERFLPDPYGPPGGRMYRTGDLCHYRDDGVLVHLGRIGRQVKVRGMRIELAEIEAVLAEHAGVARCVVTADPGHDGRIVAFVVPAPNRDGPASSLVPALLEHAARILPSHMVPASTVVVADIPSFVSGKVDTGALLALVEPAQAAVDAAAGIPGGGPASAVEERLAGIFRRVLSLLDVDVTESFFALGGHSLLAMELLESCAKEFGVRPGVRDLFANSSVRELAEWVTAAPQTNEANPVRLMGGPPGRPMIVFVHAAGGSVLPFLPVARMLADDFTSHGLQTLPDRSSLSIEELAADYVTAVDGVRTGEPVTLVGWSMGGCVAVEMARLWQGRGVPVAATVLLDTWAPPAFMTTPAAASRVRHAIRALDALALEGMTDNSIGEADLAALVANTERNRDAFLDYAPGCYDGSIDLVRAADPVSQDGVEFPAGYLDGDRGWSRFAADVATVDVVGSHFSVLDDAHAESLADTIIEIVESRTLRR